ncbi:MAG: DUF378 domain-containing protein [Candidatus Carbobacillus altaicus]|uniref:DUF378 domain-containing protein n=1 Tax=Candidatus Carbonibacillus altaicus TaxID=2163959 RepID=A0A2R6Y2K7_9BACL|nr:MAG: DUF378 domain-containing protein [Candidatus Carbobacillus altaicus]
MRTLALILIIIGGLNWLLVGLFQFDLVGAIFGGTYTTLARTVYVIVGIAALYALTLIPLVSRRGEHEHVEA